jgi:hypothetical protein
VCFGERGVEVLYGIIYPPQVAIDEHDDSIVRVTLEEVEDGTLLTLVHSNAPDEQTSCQQGGWQERISNQ